MHSRVSTFRAVALAVPLTVLFVGCSRGDRESRDAGNAQASAETSAESRSAPASRSPARKAPPPPPAARATADDFIRPGDPPRHPASAAQVEQAIKRLSNHVREGATDPLNPWAMAHGMLAFGSDLKTANGESVADLIVREYLTTRKVDDRTVHGFQPRTRGNVPLEPHPSMVAKAFAEAGVPFDRSFQFKEGKTTLSKLLDDATWTFSTPTSDREWHNFGWLASLIAIHPPKDGNIQTRRGPVPVKDVAARALAQLEREQAFLVPFQQKRRPDLVVKQRQGIYTHTCGGLHFVQGTARLAGPYPELHARVRAQLDLVRFRWAAERRIYRQLADMKPKYRPLLLVQELKFYGHLLETMALAVKWKLVVADPALKKEMQLVAGDLLDTLRALEPYYQRLVSIRSMTPQTYYDLIGDGCHAIRGMREALVAFY